ncbi:MAG TPA: non-homologous end-joining DNA ligase [Gemmataceae bacterium]|nr:non-homologous end-joining DNA ligase [Gemmataceae bacterium]
MSRLASRLKPVPLPSEPAPMLATLIAEPFDNPDWIFEPKFDGLRILGRFDGRQLTLLSRNNKPQNFQFPEIAAGLEAGLKHPVIVDGEVVCLDENGHSSFRLLQQRFHLESAAEVQARMKKFPAHIYLFDVLYLERYDVRGLTLEERKKLLHDAVRWSKQVRWTEFHKERGIVLWREACRAGLEGIIGKHLQSIYVPTRSSNWVKIKCIGRQEFVIGGFTDPQRSRVGLGALLVGYYDDAGKRLLYAGKVGTGFTHEVLLDLRKRLDKIEQVTCPFDAGDPPRGTQVHWVQPRLVAEIAYAEWTQNGLLRQPRFEGLRPDKKPHECRRERPKAVPNGQTSAAGRGARHRG